MKIGLLGGTRFIGYHLVEALLGQGAEVSLFHRGRTAEPRPFSGAVRRFHGDRDRPATLAPFFERSYDAVIDLSGYTPAQVAPVLAHRGKIGHYLFCSSTAVYRAPPLRFGEQSPRILEAGTYGGDKALSEDAVLALSEKQRWPATIFRPHAVFGPFGAPHAHYVFSRLRASAPVLVRPEAVGKRLNFLWVDDLVECFTRAIGRSDAFGQAFNLAGAEAHSPESFGLLLAAIARGGAFRPLVLDADLARRFPDLGLPWTSHDLVADGAKILASLGVSLTPLEDGLRRTWEWCGAEPARLGLNLQRWEAQARAGRRPSLGHWLFWRFYDSPALLLARRAAKAALRRG